MNGENTILFYDDGEPMDPRCIKWFLSSLPESYTKTVTKIIEHPTAKTIEQSMSLDKDSFEKNIATLLPNFGMTRNGALKGIKIKKDGRPNDPKGIVNECWNKMEADLLNIKQVTKNNGRALQELQGKDMEYVIDKTSELFKSLCIHFNNRSGRHITRVGVSKILFSVLPEIALPVDTVEWDKVFRTNDDYKLILTTMKNEISKWEKAKKPQKIDELDPNKPSTTLPAVYNVMAMRARP